MNLASDFHTLLIHYPYQPTLEAMAEKILDVWFPERVITCPSPPIKPMLRSRQDGKTMTYSWVQEKTETRHLYTAYLATPSTFRNFSLLICDHGGLYTVEMRRDTNGEDWKELYFAILPGTTVYANGHVTDTAESHIIE